MLANMFKSVFIFIFKLKFKTNFERHYQGMTTYTTKQLQNDQKSFQFGTTYILEIMKHAVTRHGDATEKLRQRNNDEC